MGCSPGRCFGPGWRCLDDHGVITIINNSTECVLKGYKWVQTSVLEGDGCKEEAEACRKQEDKNLFIFIAIILPILMICSCLIFCSLRGKFHQEVKSNIEIMDQVALKRNEV